MSLGAPVRLRPPLVDLLAKRFKVAVEVHVTFRMGPGVKLLPHRKLRIQLAHDLDELGGDRDQRRQVALEFVDAQPKIRPVLQDDDPLSSWRSWQRHRARWIPIDALREDVPQ